MKIKVILICIFALAILLRFYNLSTNPPALTWDEASWGYNAYTLGETGKDEFGKFLPVTYLESFGDFKPPMYAYLSVVPVKLLGMTEFSVRFISALFGSITVLLTFFLVSVLFAHSKQKNYLGLGAAFLLAISPWHILLSRAAFEANVATFFIVLGVTLFLFSTAATKVKVYLFALSLLSFLAAMYTFNTSRVFLPLFVFALFVLKHKVLLSNWKKSIIGLIPAVLLAVPLGLFLITPQAQLRYQEVNIFSDVSVIKRVNQQIENDHNSIFSKAIHNRRLAYGVEYIKHYLDNVDPGFLFIHGDGNPKFSIQDVGQMYIWELPFLLLGGFLLFRKREGNWVVLPIWFILGIIPAATARETPHALRIETIIPVPQILVAYGIVYAAKFISDAKYQLLGFRVRNIIFGVFGVFVLFNFLYFVHSYFVHYPVKYAQEWQYGYKDAVSFAESQKKSYEAIYMTDALGRPYIYTLLYGNYAPDTLVKDSNVTREALGFVHVNRVGKYFFYETLPRNSSKKILYIDQPGKVPDSAQIVKRFLLPNGNAALVAYTL